MQLPTDILSIFQNRLKIGNRKNIQLNAHPGRSRLKLDLCFMDKAGSGKSKEFLETLLTKEEFEFTLNLSDCNDLSFVADLNGTLEALLDKNQLIMDETGVEPFAFGYPILAIPNHHSDLILAPLIIWTLKITKGSQLNTITVSKKTDDYAFFNEILKNYLETELRIDLGGLYDLISEDESLLDKDELLSVVQYFQKKLNFKVKGTELTTAISVPIPFFKREEYEPNNIYQSGIFGIFEISRQNINKDYDDLISQGNADLGRKAIRNTPYYNLSLIKTDPSQQNLLNSLNTESKILLQGPPGTGKSTAITAVLVNALLNDKRVLVVCEKKAALDVLAKNLDELGLTNNYAFILNASKDRFHVIKKARQIIGGIKKKPHVDRNLQNKEEEEFQRLYTDTMKLIRFVNQQLHLLNGEKIDQHNLTELIGICMETKRVSEDMQLLPFENYPFAYSEEEFLSIERCVENAKDHYEHYKSIKDLTPFLPESLVATNLINTEIKIRRNFKTYQSLLEELIALLPQCESLYQQKLVETHQQITSILTELSVYATRYKSGILGNLFNTTSSNRLYQTLSGLIPFFATLYQDQNRASFLLNQLKGFMPDFLSSHSLKEALKLMESASADIIVNTKRTFDNVNFYQELPPHLQTPLLKSFLEKCRALHNRITQDNWLIKSLKQTTFHNFTMYVTEAIKAKDNYFHIPNALEYQITWIQLVKQSSKEQFFILSLLENVPTDQWMQSFRYSYFHHYTLHKIQHEHELLTDNFKFSQIDNKLKILGKAGLSIVKNKWHERKVKAVERFKNDQQMTVENLFRLKRLLRSKNKQSG